MMVCLTSDNTMRIRSFTAEKTLRENASGHNCVDTALLVFDSIPMGNGNAPSRLLTLMHNTGTGYELDVPGGYLSTLDYRWHFDRVDGKSLESMPDGTDILTYGWLAGRRKLYDCMTRNAEEKLGSVLNSVKLCPCYLLTARLIEGRLFTATKVFVNVTWERGGDGIGGQYISGFHEDEWKKNSAHRKEHGIEMTNLGMLWEMLAEKSTKLSPRLTCVLESLREKAADIHIPAFPQSGSAIHSYEDYAQGMTHDCADPDDGTAQCRGTFYGRIYGSEEPDDLPGFLRSQISAEHDRDQQEYYDLMTRDCADPDDGTLRSSEQVHEAWKLLGFQDYNQDLPD